MNANICLVVYVDVDDTLVRSAGTKSVPMPNVVNQVKKLAGAGAQLYCWSTAGAEYARSTAHRLGIESCFVGFLPKPNILIDDQALSEWKRFSIVHPLSASCMSPDEYLALVDNPD
jgi:predicted HAD superfamily phosphohydrolase YqeG